MERSDLKKAGLKVTAPRLRILEMLDQNQERHLSAEDIYRALIEGGDDIGLATIYRVLTQFQAAGLVNRHNFEEGRSVFELADSCHHDHLVCTECGRVVEFVDASIEQRQDEVAAEKGFRITAHSLNIYGVCPDCQEAEST